MIDLSMHLAKGVVKANYDQSTFRKWEDNVIDTNMAMTRFRSNNEISEDLEFSEEDFILFLRSLGYVRERE